MTNQGGDRPKCLADCETKEEPCQHTLSSEGKCPVHGEDGGVRDGVGSGTTEQNALANGGGAPVGNKNAITHGMQAVQNDPAGTLDWLQEHRPAAYDWVVDAYLGYLEAAPFTGESQLADFLLTLTLYEYAAKNGMHTQIEEGLLTMRPVKDEKTGEVFEFEDSNPINLEIDRILRTLIRGKKELGVFEGGPAMKNAEARQDLAEAARRLAERQDGDVIDVPSTGGD